MTSNRRRLALCLFGAATTIASVMATPPAEAKRRVRTPAQATANQPHTPEILASASNSVPACVTPERLNAALAERNPRLDGKFKGIATYYKSHGEKLGVRWDYAFYQMILETNSLLYTGDVKSSQNNFAGIGATGGGVRGESFPDVSTGVLAQLQHLIAYSGNKVDKPVAKRTRENQDSIIAQSKRLGRPVRFADLTNRWAADSKYARSIEMVAERFKSSACSGQPDAVASAASTDAAPSAEMPTPKRERRRKGRGKDAVSEQAVQAAPAEALPEQAQAEAEPHGKTSGRRRKGRDLAKKAVDDSKVEDTPSTSLGAVAVAPPNPNCSVMAASFGGSVTLLIRAEASGAITYTALDVEGGAEQAMADSYMKVHAQGGKVAGRFKTRDEAISHAYTLCDSGKP